MTFTINMDASGRLVLPKAVRDQLSLGRGASLRAEVVAGHIELVPVDSAAAELVTRKAGIAVLKSSGARADAGAAVAAERNELEGRGLRR